MPRCLLLPLLLIACGEEPGATPADLRLAPPAPGWGALFWREGVAYQRGGGDVIVGPKGIATLQRSEVAGACGAKVEGAPVAAVLAPPIGATVEPPPDPPAVANTVVEAAVARAAELLPPPDPYTPAGPNPDPTKEAGVQVGSVVKARRVGAPPILIVSALRDCTGLIAILEADARTVLDHRQIPGLCTLPRALAPADLDGDGARETALFNAERVVLFRLDEAAGRAKLVALGDWSCPLTP
jgi:hypothetical protein